MTERFDVLFFDTADTLVTVPGGVTVGVERWVESSRGGVVRCELFAEGHEEALGQLSTFLGYRVLVTDCAARPVWWGTVEETATPGGERMFGLSLAGMVNRVAVIYTENNERFTTDWQEDSDSVALYGRRERLVSLAVGRQAQAEAERTTHLNLLKLPAGDVQVEGGDGRARLRCVGYWQRLGKVYYASSEGYERHLTGSGTEKIGQSGYTLAGIRFEDNKIYVGSAYHFVETEAIQKLGQSAYAAGTIGFEDGVDRIYDTANGFGAFVAGDEITVSGTADNDGTYEVASATASEIISTTDLDSEAVGTATITPDSYTMLTESFSTAGGELRKVRVRAFRGGTVADNLTCSIFADSAGSPGGAALQVVHVAGSSISTEKGWVEFEFPGTLALVGGTTYWKVYSRSGGNSASGAYAFEVDEGTGYGGGVMKVWNGSAWVARPRGAADLLFEVVYSPADDIEAFVADDVIVVSGSASNDDTYTVSSVETASYPWYLQVEVTLVPEAAGASVTLATRYTRLAQRFLVSDATGWILNLAKVKAQKVGSSAPTDGLTVQIHADSAGAIGSSLATATVDAADILATALSFVTADWGTTLSLTAGTHYWLSVKRTGTESSQTGYVIAVDDDAGYADGKLQGWDGAWGDRDPASDLVFELVGVRETTQLLYDILTATGLFAGVDVRVSSGVYASPYYDGDSLAQGAVERLLKGGTSGGNMLLATVTPERWVRIEAAPGVSDAYGMKGNGVWVDGLDREVPPWRVPAGVWLRQLDVPGSLDVAALATVIEQFVEEIEYDAMRNVARARFRQARNPFNIGLVVG